MTINFLEEVGKQLELTIVEFAESLSLGCVFGLAERAYEASPEVNAYLAERSSLKYHSPTQYPNATMLADYINTLEDIGDVFEYRISFSTDVLFTKYVNMTFTKQGRNVLVEIH